MPITEVGGNLHSFTRRHKTFSRRSQLHFNYLKHEAPHESTSLSSSPRYSKHHWFVSWFPSFAHLSFW